MANSTSTTTSDEGVNSVNAIVLPIFAGFAIIGLYMPMYDFFRKRNFAMCSMIIAVTVLNFYAMVNSLIWRNDDFDTWFGGEGLCDIEVNSRYMMTTVLLTSMTCFTKNLADVFDSKNTAFMQTTAMKRRKVAIDIVFCWGMAVLQIALHYVVATGRYAIQPIWGCDDDLDHSWPFLVFYWLPFPIFNFFSGYYACKPPAVLDNAFLT
jgi:pheromone a factor receptor